MLEAPARLDDVRRELDEYFEGRRARLRPADRLGARRAVRPPRAAGHGGDPVRRVATYGEVAAQAGNPKASRAAGRALGANPIPIVVPCHRVIGAGGRLTGYTGGLHRKVALLRDRGRRPPGLARRPAPPLARTSLRAFLAHPWTLEAFGQRPRFGPNTLRHVEQSVAAARRASACRSSRHVAFEAGLEALLDGLERRLLAGESA